MLCVFRCSVVVGEMSAAMLAASVALAEARIEIRDIITCLEVVSALLYLSIFIFCVLCESFD